MSGIVELLEEVWDAIVSFFTGEKAGGPVAGCPLKGPEIPKGCEYLKKGGTVESTKADFDRIRKPTKISPPVAVKHKFPGDANDVDAISQTVEVDGRKIEVISPKNGAPAGKNLPTIDQIAAALGAVPSKQLDKISTVELSDQDNPSDAYWAQQYNMPGFHSAATGGPGGVTFYPSSNAWTQEFCDSTAIHEGGHAYSLNLWNDPQLKKDWESAIASDKRAPSDYAESSTGEDFSESLVMYSLSKGTKCEATAKALYPARYAALDGLLQ